MNLIKKIRNRFIILEKKQDFLINYMIRNQEILATQSAFEKYRNIHKGEDFVIVATGPTLKEYKALENCNYIGVNKAYKKENLNYKYYFLQDYIAVKEYIEEVFKNVDGTIFTARYLMEQDINYVQIPQKYIKKYSTIPYFTLWPLENIEPDITYSPLVNCGTVVFAAIQFALFCGARKVYLVGCDSTANGYFDGSQQNKPEITVNQKKLVENYKRIKKFAEIYYPNSKIISINPVGLRGVFEDVYQ